MADSIKDTHNEVAINVVKTNKLKTTVKGESVDILVAKLVSIRQQGKPANVYAKENEDLLKKLETAYINDGIPNMVAATYATNSAVKAIMKNTSNDRVELIMESGTFNNLNEVIAKFISSCIEAYGQPNSILAFDQGRNLDKRNRSGSYRDHIIEASNLTIIIIVTATVAIIIIVTTIMKEVTLTVIEVMWVIETIPPITAILIAFPNNLRKTKKPPNVSTYNFNLNLYSYLKCRLFTNNSSSIFLIDTGADISVIKHNKVVNEPIDSSNITNINTINESNSNTRIN